MSFQKQQQLASIRDNISKTSVVNFDEALLLLEEFPINDAEIVPTQETIVPEDIDISAVGGNERLPLSTTVYEVDKTAIDDESEPEESLPIKFNQEDEHVRLKMRLLLAHFNQEQLDRYESMRRASLPKSIIRRLIHQHTGFSPNQNVVIAMAGMVKLFVGELIEDALDILEMDVDNNPGQPESSCAKKSIEPKHLYLALDNMHQKNALFPARPRVYGTKLFGAQSL